MNENLSRGFKNDELMTRLCIFQLGNNEHKVIWSSHHLLCDGWSVSILIDELFQLYETTNAGTMVELPMVKPFETFIDWTSHKTMAESTSFLARLFIRIQSEN